MAKVEVMKASEMSESELYSSQSDSARSLNPGTAISVNNPARAATISNQPERERISAVVSSAKTRKRSTLGKKAKNLVTDIWQNVLRPALETTIVDMVEQAVEIAVLGESTGRSRKSSKGHISFSEPYRNNGVKRARERDRREERQSMILDSYEDITYDTKEDAKAVLRTMMSRAEKYERGATILDLFDASGKSAYDPIFDRFGWDLDDLYSVTIGSYYDRVEKETRWYLNFPKYHEV